MGHTQNFLCRHGWMVDEKINQMHNYYLDDDYGLASSLILIKRHPDQDNVAPLPYISRQVDLAEIPYFYGHSVPLPYPRYIRCDEVHEYW